jgi:hypothetical protein
MKKAAEEKTEVPKKKVLAPLPDIYEDGDINMHSSMIRDEEEFIQLWKRSSKQDLKKAYAKAKKWRDQFEQKTN